MTEALPIDAVLPQVLEALAQQPRAVLVAAPGAGKTTRVPLALLGADWRGDGRIVMLEPRRLAARAAARRMAFHLGEAVGATVGYRVRLDECLSAQTRIEVVTEGVFTRMILNDPELTGIAALVFDEFHERSLDGDFGLALALDAAQLREDLRILVMSATLDDTRVAALLGDVPVIRVAGRAFPVSTEHVPREPGLRWEDQMAELVRRALREQTGSILAFLPGQAEIHRVAERLEGRTGAEVDVVPLHGMLDAQAQDQAIQPAPAGRRKVVLATSIAETSLTIEGVQVVVDGGLVRVPRYEPGTGLTRLETVRVSRASAEQRRGRAGRTAPGVCYRLWAESQTAGLLPFDRPAILEADLAALVLDLAAWGVHDPAQLAFLDPPPAAAWGEARDLLATLGALDPAGQLTATGRALAALPLHPRLGHMLLAGVRAGDGVTAAELAVLVSEPGLGGDAADLADRLDRFRQARGARVEEARKLARRLLQRAARHPAVTRAPQAPRAGASAVLSVGLHLAQAYPDRVAQARGARGHFRLANGRGGVLEAHERLASASWLVVADLAGQAAHARIRLAVALDTAEVSMALAGRLQQEDRLQFDPATGAVRARRVSGWQALVLSDAPAPVTDLARAAEVLAEGLAQQGLEGLPWSAEQAAWLARACYARERLGDAWPDCSPTALAASVQQWLAPALQGCTARDEITPAQLGQALDLLLPYARRQALAAELPSHFEAPTGNRIPIDYAAENGPVLAIRVQELFGLDRHPAVGGGRIPLLLQLLSPAHRPIQLTRDLPGFWRGSWRAVAKDLKGRYPRHPWPDDPLAAMPTARAKPRPAAG